MGSILGDNCNYNASGVVLHVGGNYNQNQNHGLFYLNGNNAASNQNANIGSRNLANGLTVLLYGITAFGRYVGMGSAHLLVKIVSIRDWFSTLFGAWEIPVDSKEEIPYMKRARNLYEKIISDANLLCAIATVDASHRWVRYPDKPNKTVLWVESTVNERVKDLREMIENGFEPSPVIKKTRYDSNARKWREICEPKLWPDQYVHHALIQVLEPVMMRGMDKWCCGSIRQRGAHYGIAAIKRWMKNDPKGTRWCVELDIRHFYDSLRPERVMERMRTLIKDHRALDLLWRVIKDGVQIGAYYSQWLANTFLQPLDRLIRQTASHYVRYMDNFTIFTRTKRAAKKIIRTVAEWLEIHDLALKDNWQYFGIRTWMAKGHKRRYPNAMGYKYGRGFTLLRKHNVLKLRRQLKRFYRARSVPVKFAQGLLSRFGMLRHCNSQTIYEDVRPKTQKELKDIVRIHAREAQAKWNMYLEKKAA